MATARAATPNAALDLQRKSSVAFDLDAGNQVGLPAALLAISVCAGEELVTRASQALAGLHGVAFGPSFRDLFTTGRRGVGACQRASAERVAFSFLEIRLHAEDDW